MLQVSPPEYEPEPEPCDVFISIPTNFISKT